MFKTEGQEVKGGGLGKSFNPGVVYAHIYGAVVKTSQTGKKSLEITLEGPAIDGFEGWALDKENPEGAKFSGQGGNSFNLSCISSGNDKSTSTI
jgi:hypothetical protein